MQSPDVHNANVFEFDTDLSVVKKKNKQKNAKMTLHEIRTDPVMAISSDVHSCIQHLDTQILDVTLYEGMCYLTICK